MGKAWTRFGCGLGKAHGKALGQESEGKPTWKERTPFGVRTRRRPSKRTRSVVIRLPRNLNTSSERSRLMTIFLASASMGGGRFAEPFCAHVNLKTNADFDETEDWPRTWWFTIITASIFSRYSCYLRADTTKYLARSAAAGIVLDEDRVYFKKRSSCNPADGYASGAFALSDIFTKLAKVRHTRPLIVVAASFQLDRNHLSQILRAAA